MKKTTYLILFILTSLVCNSALSQTTISFDDQGFNACIEISDTHAFSAIGKSFNIYAANFDGTPSANGSLWYDVAEGGCWQSFPTEFEDGGFVTAGYAGSQSAQQWYAPEALVIKTTDGSAFKFTSFKAHDAEWNFWGNYLKISGYKDGVLQGSESVVILSDVEPYHSTVILTYPVFESVDEVRITMDKDNNPAFGDPGIQQSDAEGLFHSFDTFVIDNAVSSATVSTVSTSAASSITDTGATLNGDVTNDGGAAVTARGFVYSSTDNAPTIGEIGVTQVTDGSGTGIFNEAISGLNSSTTYYYQAYATNSEGTAYGGVVNFTTSAANTSPIVDLNTGLTVTEGEAGIIDSGKLHFNDDETEDDSQLTATITSAVANGTLFIDNNFNYSFDAGDEELLVSATFTQDDINNDLLIYISTTDSDTEDSFEFALSDPDGGELTNQSFTITINQVELPTITTTAASDVTTTTVTLGGHVADNGGSTVTERGIVYNTTGTPNVNGDTKVQIGDGDGSFSDEITGLNAGKTYYVRAYATNTAGTSYGSEVSFTTSTPSLTLSSSATDDTINLGSSVTFTATASGTSSTNYLWKKNGIVIPGETNATYTTSSLVNGDVVEVQLSANLGTIVNSNLVLHLNAGNQSSYSGSGTIWTDISSNSNDATLPSTLATSYSTIVGAGSFNFQGNSSTTIQSNAVSNWDITSANALSVETWVKRTNYGNYQFWFSTPNLHYRLGVDPTGNLFWDMGHYADRNSGVLVSEGVWHHIVYTAGIESGNMTTRVYVDGIEVAIQNEGINTLSSITDYLIGDAQTPGQHPLNGDMGLIRIYNKTLSSSEITQNYNAELNRFTTDVLSSNSIMMDVIASPTVTTTAALNVTTTTATLGGNVTDNGGASVTERGIVYNTMGTPNVDDDTKIQIGSGDGSFSDDIMGLIAGTTYYVRAYATNTVGTSYGSEESFITATLGLEEDLLNNAINFYPNPINNMLYVSKHTKVENVSLFDVLGKRINNIKMENNTINLSNIKTGIYLLKIETDRGSLGKRIVKK